MSEPAYFFIVGSPRSGTTLLQTMLMRAPGVVMPPELHFIHITYKRRHRMADIRTDKGWQQARNAILARCQHSDIEMDRTLFDELCATCDRTYADLFRCWLRAIGAPENARFVGEKTPNHCEWILELSAMFPEARFVHIMRDPRDSALSQREAFHRPALQAAVRWKRDLEMHRDCVRLMPRSRYTAVRYEDLVTDPESVLRPLCELLGLEYCDAMLDPSGREKKGFSSYEKHKLRTLEKVTSSRIGRYKGKMNAVDIAVIERICGPLMLEMGYELERKPTLLAWLGIAVQAPLVVWKRIVGDRRRQSMLDREAAEGKPVFHQEKAA
ncbi:MAG: sulfotransferase [Planctomycetota bacterium]|nr:MAG: sulfotransferase [Planctomycetota bacterium]